MKYAALSDLHLGQSGLDGIGEVSLLSYRTNTKKIESLASTIRDFADGSPISLILVGDILDLSLSYMETALDDFINLLYRLPKFEHIVYVVGNHDHHVWTIHCEHKNVISRMERGFLPRKGSIYEATPLQGEYFYLLEKLIANNSFSIVYPMYKINIFYSRPPFWWPLYFYL